MQYQTFSLLAIDKVEVSFNSQSRCHTLGIFSWPVLSSEACWWSPLESPTWKCSTSWPPPAQWMHTAIQEALLRSDLVTVNTCLGLSSSVLAFDVFFLTIPTVSSSRGLMEIGLMKSFRWSGMSSSRLAACFRLLPAFFNRYQTPLTKPSCSLPHTW